MKFTHLLTGALFATVIGMTTAQAAPGYADTGVSLRAGPGRDYPVITRVPAGAPLDIGGCTSGLAYCDVNFQGLHGWVSGRHLQILEGRRRVYVYQARPAVFPVVTFNQGDYWGRYYRDRPFYKEGHPGPAGHGPGRPGPGPSHGPRGPQAHPLYQPQPGPAREDHSHGWDWMPQNPQPHEQDWDR